MKGGGLIFRRVRRAYYQRAFRGFGRLYSGVRVFSHDSRHREKFSVSGLQCFTPEFHCFNPELHLARITIFSGLKSK